MGIEVKRGENSNGGISILNQLTASLEEAETKLEQAYEREHYEQVKAIKDFILKLQGQIAEELKRK
jgi:hypothetical protein